MPYLQTPSREFNRQSVQSAIKSTQQRLKTYTNSTFPANGLALFCGLATTESNRKERLLVVSLTPARSIPSLVYRCDNHFHTEYLDEIMFENDGSDSYGFVVVDGHSTLIGIAHGTTRKILQQFTVDLPNKHRKGGQSAVRFARLRDHARQAYARKVAERCNASFIVNNKPNVKGLVMAGSADFKDTVVKNLALDKRLRKLIICSVDLARGGRRGFDEAIQRSAETLGNLRVTQQARLLRSFFDQIEQDSGLYCFSVKDTLSALEVGAVQDLILWEDLDVYRIVKIDPQSGNESVVFTQTDQEGAGIADMPSDEDSIETLAEWLCDHYKEFGCQLHLVSDHTTLGAQFVRGFGGIGGVLRFPMPTAAEAVDVSSQSGEDGDTGDGENCYDFDDGDFTF